MSYISGVCNSLVRQSCYISNRFILKISDLNAILIPTKGHRHGHVFYMNEYMLISPFSQYKGVHKSETVVEDRAGARTLKSDANLLAELLQDCAVFIVIGGVISIRPSE